jgi:hypothetical protein
MMLNRLCVMAMTMNRQISTPHLFFDNSNPGLRSSIAGLYFVQTHRARSEGQVRWVQPENGAVTRYFASIILRA